MRRNVVNMLLFAIAASVMATGAIRAQGLRLGAPVPDFTVRDMSGHAQKYHHSAKGGVTVVMFFSTRCPISNAFNFRRNTLYDDYKGKVKFLVVDPNSNEPLAEVKQYAKDVGFDFPVYKDVDNEVANRFGVLATTDTFVIDSAGVMRYHGYVEDSPNASRATKQGLRLAIDAVLQGKPVAMAETKSIGCAIRRVKP